MKKVKILSFLLLCLVTSFLVISIDVHATSASRYIYDQEMEQLGVDIDVSNNAGSLNSFDDYRLYWNETLGYIDFTALYGSAITSTTVYADIDSTNTRFTTAVFYNQVTADLIYFDFYTNTLEINYTYGGNAGSGTLYIAFYGDEFRIPLDTYSQWTLRLIDNDFTISSAINIYEAGDVAGFARAKSTYFTDIFEYVDNVKVSGSDGYHDSAYDAGVTQGISNALCNTTELLNFVPAILGIFFGFFMQLASINAMGISLLDILAALFGIVVILIIWKIFIKR